MQSERLKRTETEGRAMVEAIESIMAQGDYDYYGLRVADGMAVGQTLEPSRVWDDGIETAELLDGTCAVEVKTGRVERAVRIARQYIGTQVALIAGHKAQHGEDSGEIIICDAEVLAVWPQVRQ